MQQLLARAVARDTGQQLHSLNLPNDKRVAPQEYTEKYGQITGFRQQHGFNLMHCCAIMVPA